MGLWRSAAAAACARAAASGLSLQRDLDSLAVTAAASE